VPGQDRPARAQDPRAEPGLAPEPFAQIRDPLAALLDLPGVGTDVATACEEIDRALLHHALRRAGGTVAAEVALRSAQASAALEGHRYDLDLLRTGTVTDPVAQGALRISAAIDALAPVWCTAPRQVLARLHVLAGTGSLPADQLGRPRLIGGSDRLRLDALCTLAVGRAQGRSLVRAALIEGELLALRLFVGPNGLVARAAGRLTLIAGGLDPRGLLATDVGHLARQPEYVGAQGAYGTGTVDGVRAWLRHCSAAAGQAAAELVRIAETVAPSR
jgi:hypothetical protein